MRLRLILSGLLVIAGLSAGAAEVRADYVVLRSGARLNVTSYELLGDKYRLQMNGGIAEIPVAEVLAIEPEEIFEPLPEPLSPTTPFHDIIRAAADRYGVDADLIHCVIAIESNFNPKAISPKNARGLMQLMPQTAAQLGVRDVFDPRENIDAGTRYLKDMLARYDNDLTLALAAYNAGPERVAQFGRRLPPYAETVKYVQRISRSYATFKSGAVTDKAQPAPKVEGLPAGK
ncbi:MAG: lytic transglycosylase domain-containing protein [Candidatus Acidiferrales bacterium]